MIDEQKVWSFLNKYCNQYIASLRKCEKGNFLLRAYKAQEINNIKLFKHNLIGRKPLNTPLDIHNKINNKFLDKFGWKIRNGAFCYNMNLIKFKPYDLGYGTNYIFFPIGNFDFVYEPNIFDLYHEIAFNKIEIDNLTFSSDNFCEAIKPAEDGDGFSVEISIKTNLYVLLNLKYSQFLIDKIWI